MLGASGCGASTTGRALADALGVAYFDSDDYFHGPSDPPYNAARAPDERYARIMADLELRPSWVLGGGVAGWDPEPELDFTQVIFLWVPWEVREVRLKRRERERFGARIEPGGDMHAQHLAFMEWASRYDVGDVEGKTFARHRAWLMQQSCRVLDVRGIDDTAQIVAACLACLNTSD